jgi:putative oxidoreductase
LHGHYEDIVEYRSDGRPISPGLSAFGEAEWRSAIGSPHRRIVLFACHGARILFDIFDSGDGQGPVPIGSWPTWWAGVIELIGGGLIFLGLFTRPAAVLCSGAMAYAYFTVHQPQSLHPLQNEGELAALYSWIFLLIAILGPGRFALDTMLRRPRPAQE